MSGGGDYEFSLAGPADEADIRRLVGTTPMPGSIAIRFEREPDYFLGCPIMGDPCDVLLARHVPDGELAGMLCRSERLAFVNGRETRIGAIGQIRIAPRHRGRWILERGLRHFGSVGPRDLVYVGAVARENARGRGALVGRRVPGAPAIRRVAGLTTLALVLHRPWPTPSRRRPFIRSSDPTPGVEAGSVASLDEIVAFLRACGPRRQFFPAYRREHFRDGRTLRDLALEDVAVVRRRGRIVGTMAMWDQSAFKQDVVASYATPMARARPLYDLAARVVGGRPLPRVGEPIRHAFGGLTCVADDDPTVLGALLARTSARARARGLAFLMVCLADDDPLLAAASRSLHVTYRSDLFALCWAGPERLAALDGRVAGIEAATL